MSRFHVALGRPVGDPGTATADPAVTRLRRAFVVLCLGLLASIAGAQSPEEITFYGPPDLPISTAVAIPAGRAQLLVSGTIPPVVDEDAPQGSVERFGDMRTQARGVFERIQGQLERAGLSMSDVVFLRVYLVPDPDTGEVDYRGFFEVYGEFFDTEENPVKPGRSTIAVTGLVMSGWLVEVDAVAVYPSDAE